MIRGPWPVGGRLCHFLDAWLSLTSDPWVLDIVQHGYRLTLSRPPPLSRSPLITPRGPHYQLLLAEVQALLTKLAIERVWDYQDSPGYYSPYFLAPKKDGSLRPILNLKTFNNFVVKEHFRLETLSSILHTLRVGDWLVSIDLKDAYLHVPIHREFRHYLRFALRDPQGRIMVFQWTVLPFGLTSSPRVFTKLLAPVMAHLHRLGHRLNPYLDDFLGASASRVQSRQDCHLFTHTLTKVGFVINAMKSRLIPSQDLVHLGARLQTVLGTVSVPEDKALVITAMARSLQRRSSVPARELMQFIGRLTACQEMVPFCMYRVRPLVQHLMACFSPRRDPLSMAVSLQDVTFQEALTFWTVPSAMMHGRSFRHPCTTHLVTTDASNYGYGAWFQNLTLSGLWDPHWAKAHINLKEMATVLLALHSFQASLSPGHVLIQSDNSTVVAYILHQGGMRSPPLNAMARELVEWCMSRNLSLAAVHVSGADNTVADSLSRPLQSAPVSDKFRSVEWSLSQRIASTLFLLWGEPQVDLYATRANRKVPVFCCRTPDPLALPRDPLSLSWSGMLIYLYPPISLVLQSLAKIRREEAEAIAILPWWPCRGWFPLVLELLVDLPIRLPLHRDLLVDPLGDPTLPWATSTLPPGDSAAIIGRSGRFSRLC
jgi:hypothetical protein